MFAISSLAWLNIYLVVPSKRGGGQERGEHLFGSAAHGGRRNKTFRNPIKKQKGESAGVKEEILLPGLAAAPTNSPGWCGGCHGEGLGEIPGDTEVALGGSSCSLSLVFELLFKFHFCNPCAFSILTFWICGACLASPTLSYTCFWFLISKKVCWWGLLFSMPSVCVFLCVLCIFVVSTLFPFICKQSVGHEFIH
ncbi:hypothetical protein ABZP36_016073 [Zizania latifolia]